jgi:hypothetical protein
MSRGGGVRHTKVVEAKLSITPQSSCKFGQKYVWDAGGLGYASCKY